ncbi:WG repeat-containing protein [Psychrobacter sp. I-STPA6b]|uniref:WG repeat-containing protein n=1 Tax=Psychrobacter sp. I-STPA6b TaxID=2585718 RepID=UPI001D0CBA77|nr:WG repeat-containing protein [Psychrobacter sp. I-STPA6b]
MFIALVRQGNKIGFINQRNEVVIELDDFDDFYEEYSNEWSCLENIVSLSKKYLYAFYKVGEGQITPHRYRYIDDEFRDGLAIAIDQDGLSCVVDTQGNHRLQGYALIRRVYHPDKTWFLVRHKRQNDDIGSDEKYKYSLRDEFDNLIVNLNEEDGYIIQANYLNFPYQAPYIIRKKQDKLALFYILGEKITDYNYDNLIWNHDNKMFIYKKYHCKKSTLFDRFRGIEVYTNISEAGILTTDGKEICLISNNIDEEDSKNKYDKGNYYDIERVINGSRLIEVKKGNKKGLIDFKGGEVLPVIYNIIYYNKNGSIPSEDKFFIKNKNWMLINKHGEVLTNFDDSYDYISDIEDNHIIFQKNEKYDVVDVNNNNIVDFVYDKVRFIDFENLAIAQNYQDNEGQKKCVEVDIIDLTTKRVIATFQDVKYYSIDNKHSIIAVFNGYKWGFFDLATRSLIILFLYHKTEIFHLGLCPVSQINEQGQEKWGAINANNETVIPFIYDDMWGFFDSERDSYTGFV